MCCFDHHRYRPDRDLGSGHPECRDRALAGRLPDSGQSNWRIRLSHRAGPDERLGIRLDLDRGYRRAELPDRAALERSPVVERRDAVQPHGQRHRLRQREFSSERLGVRRGRGARAGDPPAVAAALRLHGSRWATEKVLSLSGFDKYVTGCNVLSPTNAWVFGAVYAGLGAGVGTWHLTRSGWHHLNTGHLSLFSASAASAKDIWAIGADLTLSGQSFLERWNGNSWQRVRSVYSVLPRKAGIGAVNAQSANSVWVQALTGAQRAPTTVVVHWNGKGWHRMPRGSVGYYLPTAVPDGNGGWWAVPYSAKELTRYLLHKANGRWTRFPLPTPQPLYIHSLRLAHIPRSRAMLATGIYLRSRHSAGVLLAFGALP